MAVFELNRNNFDLAINSDKPVLLDFYAEWCGPCRMLAPLIKQIAEENPQYFVGKINVENAPELAEEFNISSVPVLVVMKNGKIVNQAVGARPKQQILQMLEG